MVAGKRQTEKKQYVNVNAEFFYVSAPTNNIL